jgi:hypothetical protein
VERLPLEGKPAEFLIRLIERGDFQGTVGLHFNEAVLRRLYALNANLVIWLEYKPEPLIDASGRCFHCDVNVFETR